MPDLDQEFGAARRDLLALIEVPELASVQTRARRLRRRRRAIAGAAAALLLLAGTGTVLTGFGRPGTTGVDVAVSPPRTATEAASGIWRGGGLTVVGLTSQVLDLPGEVRDVQFADRDRGYALAAECPRTEGSCTITIATTTDGGRTWTTPDWLAPPRAVTAGGMPALVPVGQGVVLAGTESWYASGQSRGFMQTGRLQGGLAVIPSGARLLAGEGPDSRCVPGPVEVWLPDGWRAVLTNQPDMAVCRVAPAPTASGAWWVGGAVGGRPAVGVSRDAGTTWQVVPLPAAPAGSWAQISTLGGHVYATVVHRRDGDPRRETLTMRAIYRSVDGGPFVAYLDGEAAGSSMIGEVLPLLDGRLVTAGPTWQVSAAAGKAFEPAGGVLPWVHRLQRTPGAWIAYDLFDAGWVAISHDGSVWQKINIR
jgi:photosystem II stability/assembly factor-like uncharacterized protein